MKQKKIAACLCMAVLLTVTGCGNADTGQPVRTADTQSQNQTVENVGEESGSQQKVSEEPADKQADTALDGIVVRVGDNSVVVSEMVTEAPEEIGDVLVYGTAEGEDIAVYFSENTQFEFRTVKNNGVNGDADVEKREGSFTDIKEGTVINMTGSYQGDDFYAEQIIIYSFV